MDKLSIFEFQVNKNDREIKQLQEEMIQMTLSWQEFIQENKLLNDKQIMYQIVKRYIPVMANREVIKQVNSHGYALQRNNVPLLDNDPNLRLKPAWDRATYWYSGTGIYW